MTYQSVNPFSGERVESFNEMTDRELESALATAATCFETWRKRATPSAR